MHNNDDKYKSELSTEFWVLVIIVIGAVGSIIYSLEQPNGKRAIQVLGDAIVKHELQPAHEWWDERYSPVTEE